MREVLGLSLFIVVCSLYGCRAFDDLRSQTITARKNELPALQAAPNAIEMEIGHIRRPANDPLLGEKLWNEVNQVIADGEDKNWQQVRQNGFRVGIAAAQPPDSLLQLLYPNIAATNSEQAEQVHMNTVMIPDGSPTKITASPHFTHCRISFPGRGEPEVREFDFAQGSFRLSATKHQDGWVELEFTPVIQHAQPKLRHTATKDGEFVMNTGQKQKVFHTERFKVRVMVGEWVVIGADPDQPGTLGHQFYFGTEADDQELQAYRRMLERTEDSDQDPQDAQPESEPQEDPQFQRLLVIRIANMKSAVAQ